MALVETGDNSDARPKRFAPYPVWSKVRIAAIVGYALYVLSFLLAGILGEVWLLLLLVPAFVICPPLPGGGALPEPIIPNLIGNLLASRHCPACGQSIFDDAGPSGYVPDSERARWWPNHECANCGHNLARREAVE
jgi:hypothetical protein